ncbi:thioesterase family protein [uncultured Microscilla sp.]|uniref:acyl-CoA thioesterase n=1 Tax=uncultured Microscilla sp. TaxID=432653 RepID=UPI002629CB9D|nr:thioesterase family protein [uncultured Microscilla sp.]
MNNKYYISVEVRWSDLDPNNHLANSAYVNYGAHIRTKFLAENGFSQAAFQAHNIGPIVFSETTHFFKEILPNEIIYLTMELKGLSENKLFFRFLHNFYKQDGTHAAQTQLSGGWLNLKARKLAVPPETLLQTIDKMPRAEGFKILTKEDLREGQVQPQKEKFVV